MSVETDWIHRDRGVLTGRDREILTGRAGEGLSDNAIHQRYYNIRERLENSILDFYLLAQHLPTEDTVQVFEPAYEWSREKRRLTDEGRSSANPEFTPFLWGWLSLIELYCYGMYVGGKPETQVLMRGLMEIGLQRAFRRYQHEFFETYQEVNASMSVDYENPVLQQNHLQDIQSEVQNEQNDVARLIYKLYDQRKIPQHVAADWMNRYVRTPDFE